MPDFLAGFLVMRFTACVGLQAVCWICWVAGFVAGFFAGFVGCQIGAGFVAGFLPLQNPPQNPSGPKAQS